MPLDEKKISLVTAGKEYKSAKEDMDNFLEQMEQSKKLEEEMKGEVGGLSGGAKQMLLVFALSTLMALIKTKTLEVPSSETFLDTINDFVDISRQQAKAEMAVVQKLRDKFPALKGSPSEDVLAEKVEKDISQAGDLLKTMWKSIEEV